MNEDPDANLPDGIPDTARWWKNRRRMAWLSVFSITATMVWVFLNPSASETQSELLTSVLWVHGAIIGAYMGFKMVERSFGKGETK